MEQQLIIKEERKLKELQNDIRINEMALKNNKLSKEIEEEQVRARREYLAHLMEENKRVLNLLI